MDKSRKMSDWDKAWIKQTCSCIHLGKFPTGTRPQMCKC